MGKKSCDVCDVEHVGLVVTGRAALAMDNGRVVQMKAGDVFYIAPGLDSWVMGEGQYISLHLMAQVTMRPINDDDNT